MNSYIILTLVLALVGLVAGYFAFTNQFAMIIVMFMGSGALMTAVFMIVFFKKIYPMLFPVRLRNYGERYDSYTVTDDTRGKIVKGKDGYEYIEMPNGRRIKMPGRQFLMKGKDAYLDLFDTKFQQFPIQINKDSLIDVKREIIPENQRVWFVDQALPMINEATKPPIDKIAQLVPIVSVFSLVVILMVSMIFVPDYWAKSWEFWKERIGEAEQQNRELLTALRKAPIVCECPGGSGDVKPIPPPG